VEKNVPSLNVKESFKEILHLTSSFLFSDTYISGKVFMKIQSVVLHVAVTDRQTDKIDQR